MAASGTRKGTGKGAGAHAFKEVKSRQMQIAKEAKWADAPVVVRVSLKAVCTIGALSAAGALQDFSRTSGAQGT